MKSRENYKEYAKTEIDECVEIAQKKLDGLLNVSKALDEANSAKLKVEGFKMLNNMIENERVMIGGLNKLYDMIDELELFKKYYITDCIYYSVELRSWSDDCIIRGRFFVEGKTEEKLYEDFCSSHVEVNTMINDVLMNVLLMIMAETDKYILYSNASCIFVSANRQLEKFLKVKNIMNDENSWQFKLLQDTANNVISNILEHIDEYEDDYNF